MTLGNKAARRSIAISGLVAVALTASPARAENYDLSRDDVAFLQELAKQDEFVRRLGDSDPGVGALSGIFASAAAGPIKIIIDWNQALIRAWRRTHEALDARDKGKVCDAITEHSDHAKNAAFFYQLYEARGCAD